MRRCRTRASSSRATSTPRATTPRTPRSSSASTPASRTPATSRTTPSTPAATASACSPTASSPMPSPAPSSGDGSAPTSTSTCTWPSARPCRWSTTSCPTCCAPEPAARHDRGGRRAPPTRSTMNATTATAPTRETAAEEGVPPQRLLQRLILPREASPDIVPLYIEASDARSGITAAGFGLGGGEQETDESGSVSARYSRGPQVDISELSERHAVVIPAQQMRSFGTYFNAFPAGYWRRWTAVRSLRLRIRTSGAGHLVVMRSTARGALQRHESRTVTGTGEHVFELPLTAFGDGGWYWFDAFAGADELAILGAEWTADADLARTEGSFSISMTTMNKVEYCLANIRTVAEDPDLRALLDVMYVIDQGSDRLSDHPGELAPLQESLGDALRVIEQ